MKIPCCDCDYGVRFSDDCFSDVLCTQTNDEMLYDETCDDAERKGEDYSEKENEG